MSEPTPTADPGLPPVEPPSAQLMVRLFLVPGLIVAVLVLLFLAGPFLYNSVGRMLGVTQADSLTGDQFLRRLDSDNLDIRYRAASDLAQVLLRKDELAADPVFALELASRLDDAMRRSAAAEKELEAKYDGLPMGERAKEDKAREADRTLIIYLAACLGNSMVPAGAPLLCELATQAKGMESAALVERRRRSLFALGTLGRNLDRFDALEAGQKEAVLEKLQKSESGIGNGERARRTRAYLAARMAGKADSMGVADAIEQAAADSDPFVREMAALAANFWTGTPREESRLEEMLVRLARDSGEGEDKLAERRAQAGEDPRALQEVTTRKGFTIQANAAIALARRGSPRARLDLLEEMLQPDVLNGIFVVRTQGRTEKPNEELVSLTVAGALRATALLAKRRPEARLTEIAARVEALRAGYGPGISAEAEKTAKALEQR